MRAIIVGLGLMAAVAHADHETGDRNLRRNPITPFISGGVHFGGDTLAETSSEELNAGDGIAGVLGINFAVSPELELEAAIGVKYTNLEADNGSATVISFPVEGLVMGRIGPHRFGGGVTVHLSPEYEAELTGGDIVVEFDDAVGYVLQYDYLASPGFRVGVRYTGIEYEVDSSTFDASSFALFGQFFFGQ